MTYEDRAVWRKSSYSGSGGTGGGECVEAARINEDQFGLRDSKNPAAGMLVLPPNAMAALLAEARGGA
jgi:hypothetical protein